MRFLRIFTICLGLFILGGWALYAKRIVVAEQAAVYTLEKLGAANIELAIAGFDLNTIRISSLNASFPEESPLQALSLQNLVLHFQASHLIKGSATKLELDSLALTPGSQSKPSAGKSESSFAFGKIRSYIPQEVAIKEISLLAPQLNNDIHLQLEVSNVTGHPLSLRTVFSGERMALKNVMLSGFMGEITLHSEDGEKIRLHETSYLEVQQLQAGSTHLEKSHFQLSANLGIDLEKKSWHLPAATIDITSQGLRSGEIFLQPSPLTLGIQAHSHPLQAHVTLQNDALSLQWKDKTIALANIRLDLLSDTTQHQLDLQLSHGTLPGRLTGKITHDGDSGSGKALFSTPLPFDLQSEEPGLSQIIQGLRVPLDLSNGLVSAKAEFTWKDNKPLNAHATFTLREGTGAYGKTTFKGLLIQQDLELFPTIRTRSPGYLSVSEISNGITFNNFAMQHQLLPSPSPRQPLLVVDSIQSELLGGIVSSNNIQIDLAKQNFDCEILLDRIDLQKIVQLTNREDLQVSGIVDGAIQAQWKDKQLLIPGGELNSREPGGTIRYLPPVNREGLSTLPAYAMTALEEFNYYSLTATPSYESDGTLRINIHMEGHSPPLNTSRPVHLNLNTEQNILSLLRSLRYSNNLTDKLDQHLRHESPEN